MAGEMNTLIVTRHAGAVEWLRRRGFHGEVIAHLAELPVEPTRVVGVLPMVLAYQLLQAGHEVYLIEFSARNGPRGQELTADEMEQFGAKLLHLGLKESHLCGLWERWVSGTVVNGCNQCGSYFLVELALEEV